MQGINDQLVGTLGSTMLTISMNNKNYETEFHVVDTTFPIVEDGILGNPFLKDNQAVIDVSKGEITYPEDITKVIPARSEIIIPVRIINKDSVNQRNILIYAQNINENIFCGNVLNTPKNQQIFNNVINQTEQSQTINIPKLSDLSHEVFHIVSMNTVKTNEIQKNANNHTQLLKETLRSHEHRRKRIH